MQRSTGTFLLIAVVLAAAGVMVWLRADDEPPVLIGGPHSEAPPLHAEVPATGPPLTATTNGLHVFVSVMQREAFVAPPAPRVVVRTGGGADLWFAVLAGVGAGASDDAVRGGLTLISIAIDAGARLLRQVDVPANGVGMHVVGPRIVAAGFVKDDQQRAIVGAHVWFGESDSSGTRREAITDDAGRFELDTPAGPGVPFVVQAAGHASQWRVLTIEPPSPELAVMLQPATTVTVQLATLSTGTDAARLYVVPNGAVSTELAQYPFFLQSVDGGHVADAPGAFTIADLPHSGTIGIVAIHPRAAIAAPRDVVLKNVAQRVVLPAPQSAGDWRGAVVDDDGQPLADVRVWSHPRARSFGGKPSLRLLPPHLDAIGCHFTATGSDGTFTIGAIAGDEPTLSLRAAGRAGRDLAWPLANSAPIVLPTWRGGEPSFRLSPPRAGTPWSAACDLSGGLRAEIAADQPWVVSFPAPGRYDVVLTTKNGDTVLGSRTDRDVVVTGPVELASPPAQ